MKAIILAGGKGTRLRPLTYKIPKALIPVQGKTLTEHVLDIYKKAGINDFLFSTSYLADKVRDYFGNGEKFGLSISYLNEDNPMGTAGPLMILKNQNQILNENFFMSNGDNLFALDLKDMLNKHQSSDVVATIALTKVEDPTKYGIAKLNGDKILEFVEKPDTTEAPSSYASSGYYILSPEIFNYIKEGDFIMLEKNVWPILAQEGKLGAYVSDAQWFDTGTPELHQKVNQEWKGV